ncbi:MAG: hypothetical protein KGZ79_14610 [Dethiobacter sp.]|jgi:DNA gyrase/topoisomerase IV subunit A|nr:hypothetical protein [Dethiobacter sp.]
MFKKITVILSVILLLLAGAVLAQANPTLPLLPENDLYEAGRGLETAQLEMARGLDQVLIHNQSADRKLQVIKRLIERGNTEHIPGLTAEYEGHEGELGQLLAGLEGPAFESILERVGTALANRLARLEAFETFITEKEEAGLPSEAIAGMQRALANQQAAFGKMQAALTKAQNGFTYALERRNAAAANRPGLPVQAAQGVTEQEEEEDQDGPGQIPGNVTLPGQAGGRP